MKKTFLTFSILITGLLIVPVSCLSVEISKNSVLPDEDQLTLAENIANNVYLCKEWENPEDCNSENYICDVSGTDWISVFGTCGVENWEEFGENWLGDWIVAEYSDEYEYLDSKIFEVIISEEEGGGILTLPENALADTLSQIGDLIDAIGPFLWLFIGVPLAFVVITRVIRMLP